MLQSSAGAGPDGGQKVMEVADFTRLITSGPPGLSKMAGIWQNWLIGDGNTTLLFILSIFIPHSQEDATLSKLYIWQNRGFFMGRLPDISEHRLGSAALSGMPDRAGSARLSSRNPGRRGDHGNPVH